MDSIFAINQNTQAKPSPEAQATSRNNEAKTEFATLMYKEVLKECFSDEFLGSSGSPYTQMSKDVFIDQLAKEMAKKNASMLPDIMPKK